MFIATKHEKTVRLVWLNSKDFSAIKKINTHSRVQVLSLVAFRTVEDPDKLNLFTLLNGGKIVKWCFEKCKKCLDQIVPVEKYDAVCPDDIQIHNGVLYSIHTFNGWINAYDPFDMSELFAMDPEEDFMISAFKISSDNSYLYFAEPGMIIGRITIKKIYNKMALNNETKFCIDKLLVSKCGNYILSSGGERLKKEKSTYYEKCVRVSHGEPSSPKKASTNQMGLTDPHQGNVSVWDTATGEFICYHVINKNSINDMALNSNENS